MIRRIYSDLPTFKDLNFGPGLNILLADTRPDSTDQQTRNRAGKSSLVEIIHFLLGSGANADSIFRGEGLQHSTFGLDFDLAGAATVVERKGAAPNNIIIRKADSSAWSITPVTHKRTGIQSLSNSKWRAILGELFFGVSERVIGDESSNFSPTFRSLFGYFARREASGGFLEPKTQSRHQQVWDWQVAITFLLGLDWTIPQQMQIVRRRDLALQELRKAARLGALGDLISTTADLRTELTVAEDRVTRLRSNVGQFQVLPEYKELEEEASDLTRRINDAADSNTLDLRLLAELEEAIHGETLPESPLLKDLYEEVGVVLPAAVLARFEDVRAFHRSVIENRRSYLDGEIRAVNRRVEARRSEMAGWDHRRAEILTLLQTHGALEHYTSLQSELSRIEARTESIRQRYIAAEQLEGKRTELEIERQRLYRRLQEDFREQRAALSSAILAFESISRELYEEAGHLTISDSPNGPTYDVTIQGERSKGITNMQIFCFDMMLMQVLAQKSLGPGFLVHDSHLFDGVDARQVAQALKIGSELAMKFGFQYIVTMNSDALPSRFPNGFAATDYILSTRLTDDSDDGGLFGFRFA